MEQSEIKEQSAIPAASATETPSLAAASSASSKVLPQQCPTCGAAAAAAANGATAPSNIYAIGRIEARFPRLSVEKEFAQATGRADTKGFTDRQALQSVLSEPENRYLVRQLRMPLHLKISVSAGCSPNVGSLIPSALKMVGPTRVMRMRCKSTPRLTSGPQAMNEASNP